MSTRRALGRRLRAWRSFRDIAHAARTLAAAQGLRWSTQSRQAARHLAWTSALLEHFGRRHAATPSVPVLLAIGTDLGLCGRLNAALAETLRSSAARQAGARIVVGMRLLDELRELEPELSLSAPASPEAIESVATHIATALEIAAPATALELSIVLTASTTNDGRPIPERWPARAGPAGQHAGPELPELAAARRALRSPIAELSDPEFARRSIAALHLRARIAHALCVAAASEAAARLFTMSRAYEASDRKIREQELHLRKLEQEAITQDMLEVRRGQRLVD